MIDVSGKAGSLWAGSWAPLSKYGLCSILIGRHFLHASWDRSGIRCILSDRKGNISLINTKLNKWKFITQVTPAPCLIKFGLAREEFLVALPDCQVRCYSAQDGSLISVLGGHEKSVKQISLNGDGTRAITVSPDIAQIWNLSTFERTRKLDVKSKVELFSVEYLSDEHLLTIFKDNSIFIWKDEKCLGQIRGPEGVLVSSSNIIKENNKLILGGRADKFYIYSINQMKLMSVLEIKGLSKVKTIGSAIGMPEHIFYLGDSQVKLLNLTDARIEVALNPQNEPVYQMEICNEWITMIRDNGSIELYHIPTIKGTVSPYEGEPLTGAQTAAMAPPSPPKPTLSISKNISTGRLNTKPLSTQNKIDRKELKNVLNGFGEFPARYRLLIWRHLLQIPENESSFKALWERGRHSSVANLDKTYPLKSQRLFRALERTISCVAHWNSLFGELDYIPIMVFPFVKLFQHSPIHCFEVISTVLFNWSRDWFSFYPNPPIPILVSIENVISHFDPRLVRHLTANEITVQDYAWPLLHTLFSEVFPKNDWMILFDHVFFNQPGFLLYVVAAYILTARGPLMSMSVRSDFQFFFHHRNPIQARAVIQETKRLIRNTPKELDLRRLVKKFEPLSEGHYPILNKYPQFVVDYRKRETEKIRKREVDFIKSKKDKNADRYYEDDPDETINVKSMTLEGTKSEDFTRSQISNNDFKKGIEDATRVRKMLLASFSRDL